MKNMVKFLEIIAFVAMIGFAFAACSNPSGLGGDSTQIGDGPNSDTQSQYVSITRVYVKDITVPETGGTPATKASVGGNYTVSTIDWGTYNTTFQPNTVYTVSVTLNAKNTFTFTGLVYAHINGQAADITDNTGSAVTLSYKFPSTDPLPPAVISSVAITDVTAPVTGAVPDTTANGTGNFTIGAVSWDPSHNSFHGGTEYTVSITLTASLGHTFNRLGSATINGLPADISNNTWTSVTLSHTFQATNLATIANVAITGVTVPVIALRRGTTASGTGNFTIGTVSWSPSITVNFQPNTVYTATVILTANPGHTFTGIGSATINGLPADISNNTGETATLSHTFPQTPTASLGFIWNAVQAGTGAEQSRFPAGYSIFGITHGNNRFVAVGQNGRMAWSYDGANWTLVANSTFGTNNIHNITWGNGIFVAVGAGGRMATSTNGQNWSTVTNTFGNSTDINTIAYGNGRFFAGGWSSGRMAMSTNGTS